MAAAYCNWLSEKEGRKPVYSENKDGQYAAGNAPDRKSHSTAAATAFPPRPNGNTRAGLGRKRAGTSVIPGGS